jgi:hypothetical protein
VIAMTNGANARFPMTPARWLTLALGVPVLLAMIAGTGFSTIANIGAGSFKVHQAIPLNGTRLTAQIDGDVTLRQAAVGSADFTGIAHYSLVRARVTATGGAIRFHCPLSVGNCDLNGTLQIPDSIASVSLSTGGGDVNVPDFSGQSLTLNAAGGNLMAGSLSGALNMSTGGGDATAATLRGGPLTLALDGGNLSVVAMRDSRATITSGGGDVTLAYTKAPTSLQITADGGNVMLTLPKSGAHYDIVTSPAGGNVSVSPSLPVGSSNKITVNSGGGDITINAGS